MGKIYYGISVDKETRELVIRARGKMERRDGKSRSINATVHELAQQFLLLS